VRAVGRHDADRAHVEEPVDERLAEGDVVHVDHFDQVRRVDEDARLVEKPQRRELVANPEPSAGEDHELIAPQKDDRYQSRPPYDGVAPEPDASATSRAVTSRLTLHAPAIALGL